jgi:hypothetical protein
MAEDGADRGLSFSTSGGVMSLAFGFQTEVDCGQIVHTPHVSRSHVCLNLLRAK